MNEQTINIGKQYSRYPAGRFPADGKFNGETFRKKFLVDPLKSLLKVRVLLDDAVDYGSSFLEEAFGGLVRKEGVSKSSLHNFLILESKNNYLIDEIWEYIDEAEAE